MIPKKIHYCWLSNDPKPERIQRLMQSWSDVLPDYEVVHWDMNRFDVNSVPWVKQAVEARKWAFAADYIRLYAVYTEGGIFLDSDVRVLKSFDPFLKHRAFGGLELEDCKPIDDPFNNGINFEAAIFGAEAGHPTIKVMLDHYTSRDFKTGNTYDMTPMPVHMTHVLERFGFRHDTRYCDQVLENDFHIYPYDYFCGRFDMTGDPLVTHNTVAIHMTTGSWLPTKIHHPYTSLRIHTKDYFKKIWKDVITLSFEGRKRRIKRLEKKK